MLKLFFIALILFGLMVGMQHYTPTAYSNTFLIPVVKYQMSYALAALIVVGLFCASKLSVS